MKKAILFFSCIILSEALGFSQQLDEIGLTQLRSELGIANVDGSGVSVLQVEGETFPNGQAGGAFYGPDPNNAQFTSKTFDDPTGLNNGASSHATSVATTIYGSNSGLARGVGEAGSPSIGIAGAVNWVIDQLGANFQGDSTPDQPVSPTAQFAEVSNHSYNIRTSTNFTVANAENALRRADWLIGQTDMTMVAGSSNTTSNGLPPLFMQGYNIIGVGQTEAGHGSGLTTLNGTGRVGVDLVAPKRDTAATASSSGAAAVVTAMAAILRQTGDGIADSDRSVVIASTLMAGATKEEFGANWSKTETQPLDQVFGAGEVNIYNSYLIQQAGEINGQLNDPTVVAGENGWDYEENLQTGDERFYKFEVGTGQKLKDLSVMLNWNAVVEDTNAAADIFEPVVDLADLSLELYNSTNGFLDQLVTDGRSDSLVDNLEHLWLENLDEGTYHLRVFNKASGSIDTSYGLAFRSIAVPEPSLSALLCFGCCLSVGRRRRQR